MKKHLSHFLIPGCLLFSACRADNISKIKFGVKGISKCYNGFSLFEEKMASVHADVKKTSTKGIAKEDLSLLPVYSWDPQMLVW